MCTGAPRVGHWHTARPPSTARAVSAQRASADLAVAHSPDWGKILNWFDDWPVINQLVTGLSHHVTPVREPSVLGDSRRLFRNFPDLNRWFIPDFPRREPLVLRPSQFQTATAVKAKAKLYLSTRIGPIDHQSLSG